MEITNAPNTWSHLLFLLLLVEAIVTFFSVRYEYRRLRISKSLDGIRFSHWIALLLFGILFIPFPYKLPFSISPLYLQGISCSIGGALMLASLYVLHIRKSRKSWYNPRTFSSPSFY